jgi:hypothetical protein
MFCDMDRKDKLVPLKKKSEDGHLDDIIPVGMQNFNFEQKKFALRVMDYIEVVFKSANFYHEVTNTYMSQRQGHSYEEIYKMIVDGASNFDSVEDDVLKIFVELYDGKSGTLGFTSMSSGKIYTNRKYFERCLVNDWPYAICGHWVHELAHAHGFYHKFWKKRQSVPYMYGKIAKRLAQRHHNGETLTPLHQPPH